MHFLQRSGAVQLQKVVTLLAAIFEDEIGVRLSVSLLARNCDFVPVAPKMAVPFEFDIRLPASPSKGNHESGHPKLVINI